MPNSSYEAARDVAEAADGGEFTLPPYLGAVDDLDYLRKWVLDQVTQMYSVDENVFDSATVLSTTLLRDFVHRALYQTSNPNPLEDVVVSDDYLGPNDVAASFRYPMFGLCGSMAWQLWEVYRAFDYQTSNISTISDTVDAFTDSHAMTEVFLTDLGKTVIQDPTYNFVYLDDSGQLMSFDEVRQAIIDGDTIEFDGFQNYRYFSEGIPDFPINPTFQQYIKDYYLNQVYSWYTEDNLTNYSLDSLFLDPRGAHDPGTWQGGVSADAAAALALVAGWVGGSVSWTDAAEQLRADGYYVTGFDLVDGAGAVDGQWLTLRLADGTYVSISLDTGMVLQGSFDQLVMEALNGATANPGVDLSALLGTVQFLALDGGVFITKEDRVPGVDQIGDDGANVLTGSNGYDRLFGHDGADTLDGRGAAADFMLGGLGDDTYLVSKTGDRIVEYAGEGYDTIVTTVDYALRAGSSIEALTTSDSASTQAINLTGNELDNLIVGNDGVNTLDGRSGADEMRGHGGDDIYYVDNAGDTVVEAAAGGYDTVITNVSYVLTAGAEIEALTTWGSATTDAINLTGNAFNNLIVGNDGANVINGGAGDDTMWGYGGNDIYIVNSAGDSVTEFAAGGYDTIAVNFSYTLAAGSEIESLTTWGSNTTQVIDLTGNELNNLLVGNAAANVIDGGAGADTMWGYGGDDTYLVDNVGDSVTEQADGGNDTVITSVSFALLAGAEVEVLTASDRSSTLAMNLTGSNTANLILGNDGANTLDGRGGEDEMRGYAGNDTYFVDTAGDIVVEGDGDGNDTVITNVSYALAAGSYIESLTTWGSSTTYSIDLTGNELNNLIVGNAGNNVIDGGAGADNMWGYGGDDTYLVDNVGDRICEQADGGYDTVLTDVSFALALEAHVEALAASDRLSVASLDLTGSNTANLILGNDGANLIDGRGGADDMRGYGGNDTYFIDQSGDAVTEQVGEGYDTVITRVSYTLAAGMEIEALTTYGSASTQAVDLTGNEFNNLIVGNDGVNTLSGGAGADTIWGYGGDDILDGGAGDDRLKGGAGADRFLLAASDAGADTILDFDIAEDRFRLEAGQQFTAASIADVNGDGVLDTILTHAGGTVTVYGSASATASDDLAHWNGLSVIG